MDPATAAARSSPCVSAPPSWGPSAGAPTGRAEGCAEDCVTCSPASPSPASPSPCPVPCWTQTSTMGAPGAGLILTPSPRRLLGSRASLPLGEGDSPSSRCSARQSPVRTCSSTCSSRICLSTVAPPLRVLTPPPAAPAAEVDCLPAVASLLQVGTALNSEASSSMERPHRGALLHTLACVTARSYGTGRGAGRNTSGIPILLHKLQVRVFLDAARSAPRPLAAEGLGSPSVTGAGLPWCHRGWAHLVAASASSSTASCRALRSSRARRPKEDRAAHTSTDAWASVGSTSRGL